MLSAIHQVGARVFSISDNLYSHEDKFMMLMKASQDESDNLSKKMKESNERIKRQGGHIGPAPFGWDVFRDTTGLRKIKENLEEQKIIKTIRKERLGTTKEKKALIAKLNGNNHLRRGKQWNASSLKKVVSHEPLYSSFASDMMSALPRSTLPTTQGRKVSSTSEEGKPRSTSGKEEKEDRMEEEERKKKAKTYFSVSKIHNKRRVQQRKK
jgi:hypothetical protein